MVQAEIDSWPVGVAAWTDKRAGIDGYAHGSLLKRGFDVLFASLLLLASLPVWLVVAVAIKLDSAGPVFFGQERVGLDGKTFRLYKFRSMRVDAEAALAELRALNEADGPVFKMRRDPRVTGVGRFLRKTSLDELPQLLNVLRGEMSVVGPRPPLPSEVEHYRPQDFVRLSVRPGLTCWWQVSARGGCSFDEWVAYDRRYVESVSFLTDVTIILRTVWVVLTCRGAH